VVEAAAQASRAKVRKAAASAKPRVGFSSANDEPRSSFVVFCHAFHPQILLSSGRIGSQLEDPRPAERNRPNLHRGACSS
jgi:hypothetical protein